MSAEIHIELVLIGLMKKGVYKLSRRHEYFYQILGQLGILQGPYCDFVCQTPTMHIERIPLDPSFFTDMCIKLLLSESFSLVLCSIGGKHGTL